jgi:hypothetical protein
MSRVPSRRPERCFIENVTTQGARMNSHWNSFRILAAGLLLTLTGAAAPSAAATQGQGASIEITSPQDGAFVSTPTVQVTGRIDPADVPARSTRTFYGRRGNCALDYQEAEQVLSLTAGSDPQCDIGAFGATASALNEVLWHGSGGQYFVEQFVSREGVPLTLDRQGKVTGTVVIGRYAGQPAEVGQGSVLIELREIDDPQLYSNSNGGYGMRGNLIGSATQQYVVGPTDGPRAIPFEFEVADDARVGIRGLQFHVTIRGANVGHGQLYLSGRTLVTVPILTSRVDVAFDTLDQGYEYAYSGGIGPRPNKVDRTVHATVAPDGTWTASVPRPGLGARTLHAGLRDADGTIVAADSTEVVLTRE